MNEKIINMDNDHQLHQEFALMRSQGIIGFRISGELLKQIEKWEYMIDEKIFKEQLATGIGIGRHPLSSQQLAAMKQAEKEGKILPYFGILGARGCCEYHFTATPEGFHISVEHTVTRKSFGIDLMYEEIGTFSDRESSYTYKYSPFPFMGDTDEETKNKPATTMTFFIQDDEYRALAKWENWNEKEALTPRYKYIFTVATLVSTCINT